MSDYLPVVEIDDDGARVDVADRIVKFLEHGPEKLNDVEPEAPFVRW